VFEISIELKKLNPKLSDLIMNRLIEVDKIFLRVELVYVAIY